MEPLNTAAIDALDAQYDFEAFERAGIQPDDAKTRIGHVLWHLAALEESVNRALHADRRERVLSADAKNALGALLKGKDEAAARIDGEYRRLADASGGACEGVAS